METGAYALDCGKDTREEYPANPVSTFLLHTSALLFTHKCPAEDSEIWQN